MQVQPKYDETSDIDEIAFNNVKQMMNERFSKFMEALIPHMNQQIAMIAESLLQNDLAQVQFIAHQLKPASQQLGLMRMYQVSRTIEHCQTLALANGQFTELEKAYKEARLFLQSEMI